MKEDDLKVLYYTSFYSDSCHPMFARMHDIWHYMNRKNDIPFDYEILTLCGDFADSDNIYSVFDKSEILMSKSESLRKVVEKVILPKEIDTRDYDIFHSIYFDSTVVKLLKIIKERRKSVKTVVGVNTLSYFEQRKGRRFNLNEMDILERWKTKRRYKLMKKYLSSDLIDLNLSLGKYHNKLLKEVGVDSDEIYELPPRVDSKYFQRNSDLMDDDGVFKILYVGDICEFKGIDVFLKALESLKKETDIDFKGIVVGDGGYPINKHSSIEENLEIVGYVDRSNISKYYNEADVYVHPSIDEVGPSTFIESLACGTPVIASDRLCFREHDTQGVSKFFELRNPKDLKNKLVEFYREDEGSFNNKEYLLDDGFVDELGKIYKER